MRLTAPLLALCLLALPLAAAAQAPTTFRHAVTYRSCSRTTAFSCNRRDASARTYGTARSFEVCTSYRFRADGRVTLVSSMGLEETAGRYRIEGPQVHIELLDEDGAVQRRETHRLSADGSSLGGLSRVDRQAQ